MSLKKQGKYRFHDFEVDLAHRSLQRAGRAVAIRTETFELLAFLVLRPQRVITPEQLMDSVWPDFVVEEEDLNQQIFLLRKALLGTKSGDKLLVTVPGHGYQFVPPVTEVAEQDSDPSAPMPEIAVAEAEDDHAADSNADPGAGVHPEVPAERSVPVNLVKPLVKPVNPANPADTDPESEFEPEPVRHEANAATSEPRHISFEEAAIGDDDSEEDFDEPRSRRGFFAGFLHPGPWHMAFITAIVIAAGFAALFYWRSSHRPVPESLGLVLADFDNTSGNPQFDPSLKTALTIDLQQSPFLKVATGEQITAQLPQMKTGQSPAPRLSPELAREACQRLNSQVYLTGVIANLESRFLVTIKAFNCATGQSLAASRGIADSPDTAVSVLDKVAVDIRKQLGEPASSVAGFSKPLFADRTASLEAMKSYSDARLLRREGKLEESLTLLQHAVEIDPQFALAFIDLATVYTDLGQREPATAAIKRAYDLRGSVDEPHRLQIVAAYNDQVTGDILASIHNYKDWSEEYPRDPLPLLRLAERENQIGKPTLALEPAQRALKLNPADASAYAVLARTQLSLGQLAEAASTCQQAIDHHLDGGQIHGILLQIAFLHLDQPSIDAQIALSKDTPAAPYMMLQQALIDFAQGKVKIAEETYASAVDAYRKQSQKEAMDRTLSAMPRIESDLGFTQMTIALLSRMSESNESNPAGASQPESNQSLTGGSADISVAWAQAGEASRAQTLLKSELDAHPASILWEEDFASQIKAAIALGQQKPEDAIEALKPASAFDMRSFAVPALRGRAYLAANQPALAEAEFHKILDHPGIEPLSHNYPLAQLGLARALAQQGKTDEADSAYQAVLQTWKDADPDLPRLKEAKAEYLKLTGAPAKATKPAAPSRSAPKPATNRR
jgi:DNA-binding winged helix-turn-helix (wHTH) protein/tetratricopeptide (TPR) repeat protein